MDTRFLYPPPSPGVCSNSCPLSQWCYLTISSSVAVFSFCFQTFPASGSFSMSWLFTAGGQNIGVSASASVLPMNIQGWFPLGLTGLISLLSELETLEMGPAIDVSAGYYDVLYSLKNTHLDFILEKEMATHSSILGWRIPGTEEPGGLLSMGSHRVGHDWSDLAAAADIIWMWELNYKESWAPKNRCFWTLVLEKTLESPLDCKEIKPVNPKGN